MRKLHLTLTLTFALLVLCFHAQASFSQVQEFETIIITTSETCFLDMNDYFQGNITSFTASPPLYISPSKFNLTYTASKFLYTPSNHVVAIKTTKDIFGDWIPGSNWYLLDNNYTLYFFSYQPQNLSFIAQYPFITGDASKYQCGDMMQLGQNLIISCIFSVNSAQWKESYFSVALATPAPVTPIIQHSVFTSNVRNLLQFTDANDTLITYYKCDPSIGNKGDFADIWNITSGANILGFTPEYFNVDESFCLQDVAVINRTIFFADFAGVVYCAVDPVAGQAQNFTANYSFGITDNILKMTVVSDNYKGQMTTTVVLQSNDFIYLYDWTDLNNSIPKNKYAVPKTSTMNLKYLDISQDFISTVVDSGTDGYNFYSFYLKQNLPGDIYYSQNFPYSLDFIDSARPQSDFVFFTNSPTDNSISANFSQLQRSILQINSTTTGTFSSSLSVNGQAEATVNVIVIAQDSTQVYIQETEQNFGLTVPGQGTFDITGLINGPLLSYQPNNTDYIVLPPFENITVNQNVTISLTNQYTFYSAEDSDSIYFFYDDPDNGISMWTCSVQFSNCTDPASVAEGSVVSMSATSKYLYYTTDGATLNAITYTNSKFPSNALTILPSTFTLSCTKLFASQSPIAPFLFCQGATSINILQLVNPKTANGYSWGTAYITDFSHVEIQVSSLFPTFVFVQNQTTIFIVDAYAVALNDSNTVVSTITVPGIDATGFNFSIGGETLLVLRYVDLSLFQYDISHPEAPVLVKTVISGTHIFNQFLSDSQNSEYIYIYAEPLTSQIPVALVYNPQATANSDYWAQIPLSEALFNVGESTYVPPRFPGIKKSDYELFLLPYQNQLGWIVRSNVEVTFSSPSGLADSDATDYQETVEVLFTGSFQTGAAAGQVVVDLILTDESVKAIQAIFYDDTIKLGNGMNTFTVDPRVCFNGTIDSYTIAPQKGDDNSSVTLVSQYTQGDQLALGASAYKLDTVNGTLVAQQEGALTFFFPNNTQTLNFVIGKNDPLTCNLMEYNPDLNMILSICLDTKSNQYYFVFTEYSTSGTPPFYTISSKNAGRSLSDVRKVVFAYAYIYVLETIDGVGDFIHLYAYTAPNVLKYTTSMTSADLGANTFTVSDFVLNYRGSSANNRLFLTDPNFGLRIVDVEYDNTPVFQNPQLISLDGPDNVIWNGIIVISEVGDLENPIVLLITSSNYKNFFVEYTPEQGISTHRTFVPTSNATNIMPCYADGNTFLLSAYSNEEKYVLVYTISNISSFANAQNFPLFYVQYETPDEKATQGCGFTLDTVGSVLYVSGAANISSYTVSPNITLNINGEISSDFITITAHSGAKSDSFQYYLVPPPDNGGNLLFVYIIVGVVALVIVIILICYCNMRIKKNRKMRIKDYSSLEQDEYGAN